MNSMVNADILRIPSEVTCVGRERVVNVDVMYVVVVVDIFYT